MIRSFDSNQDPTLLKPSDSFCWNLLWSFPEVYPTKHSSWWRHLEDVFRLCLQETSSRCLQDVLVKTNNFVWPYIFKTSSIRFQDAFKTSCQDVFKTFWRRLQDILERHLQDVFKKYHQVKLFLLTSLRDGDLQKDLPRSHFWEIYGQCTKLARVIKISQVLVFHFTTPFSGYLQGRI